MILFAGLMVASEQLSAQATVRATTEDGRKVLLYPDMKWRYATEAVETAAVGATFTKPSSASRTVDIQAGSSRLSYDPAKWSQETTTDRTRMTFQHVTGDGYGTIIRERVEMTLPALRTLALNNALQAAPDAEVVYEDSRIVNGTKVLCLIIEGTTSGVAFTYLGYYYSGKSGVVQLVMYTGRNLFDEYRPDFEDFLNGFEVVAQ